MLHRLSLLLLRRLANPYAVSKQFLTFFAAVATLSHGTLAFALQITEVQIDNSVDLDQNHTLRVKAAAASNELHLGFLLAGRYVVNIAQLAVTAPELATRIYTPI